MDTQQNNSTTDQLKTNDCSASGNKKLKQGSNVRSAISQLTAGAGFAMLIFGNGIILVMPTIVIGGLLNNKEELFLLDEESASWFGSIIFISQPLGSVVSGFLQDMFGRKRCMMMVNIPQLIAWIIMYYSTNVIYLYTAAILLGLSLGFMEAPVLSYVGEITEPHLRGMLSSLTGSFAGIGILLECLIGALTDWRSTCAVCATVPVLAFITISMIPESPIWLITQGRISEAEQALCWLRGWVHPVYVREEFLALLEYTKSASTKEMVNVPANIINKEPIESFQESKSINIGIGSTFILLLQPKFHRPLRLVLIYFFISHNISLVGIKPFLVHIFKLIGMPMDPRWVLVVSVGLQSIGSLIGMIFMKLLGKRKVNFISLLTCIICCYMLAVSIKLGDVIPWIPFGLFCTLFFAAGFGVLPLPWILLSEVFPLEGRGIASGVAAAGNYFQGFIVTKTYINFSNWLGLHGTLCMYGTIGIFGLFYLYYCLPETEGKTLEEIEEYFRVRKVKQNSQLSTEVMHNNKPCWDYNFFSQINLESLSDFMFVLMYFSCHTGMDTQLNDRNGVSTKGDLPNPGHKNCNGSRGTLRSTLAQIVAMTGFGVFILAVGQVATVPTIIIGALLNNNKEDFLLDDNDASWFGSIVFITQPVGALSSGFCQDIIGRKRTMLAVNIPILIGWILLYYSSSVLHLNWAASLLGVSLGFIEAPALSYIGEVSEPHLRGVMSLFVGVFASVGMLLESFIGALTDWRTSCAIGAVFPVIAIISLSMIPESPSWLVTQNRISDAEKALCWLRGWVHPIKVREEFLLLLEYIKSPESKEMESITESKKNNNTTDNETKKNKKGGIISKLRVLTKPSVYRPLWMILIYFFISNSVSLSGIRPFLVYIFKLIGMPMDPNWVLVITAGLQIIGSFVGMFSLRLFGKRNVNFITLFICTICCYIIGISLIVKNVTPWVPFIFLNLLFFAAGCGVLPLPWILIAEVFPLEGKGIASGLAGALSYVMIFIITKTYVNLSAWFDLHGTIFIYGTIGLFGLLYTYFYLPETEGKTLQEIEEFFKDKKSNKK
ncbi:uncharacterized protein LOC142317603 [Lycorma delicatula]|uniref:uncharacterized protein LOC142317603 n=1 Tax=Lycorma delicatula TaxID=130591 RepID=UPI003F51252A